MTDWSSESQMKRLIGFFSSVKLAIALIIIITLVSVLGTLVPQQRSLEEYAEHYGRLSQLLTKSGFTDVYHSWWFIALLVFFSLNIIVCTLKRLSPKLRRAFNPSMEFEPKSLLSMKNKDRFSRKAGLSATQDAVEKELSSRYYRVKTRQKNNRLFFLGRKRIMGLFGSDIVHLGLLVILLGGIISGLAGFRTNLNITEGEILTVPHAEFQLKLDKFNTEYYPDGRIKDWKSTLTVIENEAPIRTQVIEVNHPLSHKGYVFYQSSYGWDWDNPQLEVWAKKSSDPDFLERLDLQLGKPARMDENLTISVLHFIPDFIINENNEITTRSLEPNNPAAFIEGWEGEEKIFSGWIFARYPDFGRIHSEKETDLTFELKDFKALQYSGIQAAKDPGVNFIWAGCTVLMIGLILAFYWPPKEIKAILEESQGRTEVTAGGTSSKNRETFASEFKEFMTSLRRSP